MLYAMLCYGSEAVTSAWTKQQEGEIMAGSKDSGEGIFSLDDFGAAKDCVKYG